VNEFVLAEFPSGELLVAATRKVRESGFSDLDTYSPYPVHGTSEALGLKKSKIPLIALCGGLCGSIGAYSMEWFCNAVDFPINVGNRLPHSPPSYIPITFEMGVLISALFIFFGLLALSKLPQPYHPVFELEEFRSASVYSYWLSVGLPEAEKPEKRTELSERLVKLGATHVSSVKESQ
jgi:hypothetical protein